MNQATSSGLDLQELTQPKAPFGQYPGVPLWLWPNVLSLDAAFIAALWHIFLAHLLRLHLGLAEPVILALSVWIIYVLDHVLDSRGAVPHYPEPVRKLFYRRHARPMLAAARGAIATTGVLAEFALPPVVFRLGIGIASLVAIYLGSVHVKPVGGRRRWPREAAVALLFTVGVALPLGFLSHSLMRVVLPSGALLFLPVWANCCAVELVDWQRAGRNGTIAPHWTAIWVGGHLTESAGLVTVLACFFGYTRQVPGPFAAASVLSALAMAFAGAQTNRFSPNLRSLLVDAALCSPLLILLAPWTHA